MRERPNHISRGHDQQSPVIEIGGSRGKFARKVLNQPTANGTIDEILNPPAAQERPARDRPLSKSGLFSVKRDLPQLRGIHPARVKRTNQAAGTRPHNEVRHDAGFLKRSNDPDMRKSARRPAAKSQTNPWADRRRDLNRWSTAGPNPRLWAGRAASEP